MPTAKVCFLLPSSIDCSISAFRCIVRSRQWDWGSVILFWQYDGASWSWISRIQCQCTVEQLCSLSIRPQVSCLSTLGPSWPREACMAMNCTLESNRLAFLAWLETLSSVRYRRLTPPSDHDWLWRRSAASAKVTSECLASPLNLPKNEERMIYQLNGAKIKYLCKRIYRALLATGLPDPLADIQVQACKLRISEHASKWAARKALFAVTKKGSRRQLLQLREISQALRTSYIASLTEWLCTTSKTPQLLVKPSWASPSAAIAKRKPCQQAVNCWLGDYCYFLIILPLQFDCQVNDSLVLTRYQQYWFSLAANLAVLVLDSYWRAHVSDSTTDEKALGYTTTPLSFSI